MPSNIPFEHRHRPSRSKRRKGEPLTPVDRLVCAVCGGLLGLLLWTFGYVIMLWAVMRGVLTLPGAGESTDLLNQFPSFAWGGVVALGFAILGAVGGAELMMDGFAKVVRLEGDIARWLHRWW